MQENKPNDTGEHAQGEPTPEACDNRQPSDDGAPCEETDRAARAEGEQQDRGELDEWRERAMRTAAEYANYRKRSVKEREEFSRYATRSLLEDLLPIVDNFEMGMQMAEAEKGSMIYIGMDMVKKQLSDFLSARGVEKISAEVGDAFDHNVHEAVQSEPSEQKEGTIVRILRPGYTFRGKLLRPVNVVTAAAAPSESAQEEA